MDLAVVDLTTKVMAILLPFISKGAEEFASKAGDAAYEKAEKLLLALRQKCSEDKKAAGSLAHFEKEPARYKTVLEEILQEKLGGDHDFASQLAQLLQNIGPVLEITQQFEEGKDIIGLKAKEMRGGRAKISQDITSAERVVGAEFDKLG